MSDAARLSDQGHALLEAGRYDEAAACLDQAQALAPYDALIHYRLGLLYGDTDRPAAALAAFDAALVFDPANARAHNNRGSALQLLERPADAKAAFERALALDPLLAPPRLNLGHLLEVDDPAAAIILYEEALALGVEPELFAHHLAAARGRTTPRAAAAWVRATFDNFAPAFDRQLATLEYDVPRQLVALLRPHDRASDVLDLGCGTGLVGAALSGYQHRIVGIDLADKMLARARDRAVYAHLENAELHEWLAAAPAAAFDIVVAADVLIYIGALEELFVGVARVLRHGGQFAFSTEECETGYELRPSGRYAQAREYVAQSGADWFKTLQAREAALRQEAGAPLAGRLYLLQRL